MRDIGCAEHAATLIGAIAQLMQSWSIGVLAVWETTIDYHDDVSSAFRLMYHGTLAHMPGTIRSAGTGFLVRAVIASRVSLAPSDCCPAWREKFSAVWACVQHDRKSPELYVCLVYLPCARGSRRRKRTIRQPWTT